MPADWTLAPSAPPDGDNPSPASPQPRPRITEDLADRIRNERLQ
jgi:hypothetical protein